MKRERAFDLAHLESDLEREEDRRQKSFNARIGNLLRDEAINDELCKKKCNDQLKSGLDMVKSDLEREEDRRQKSFNARIGNLLRDEAINDELCKKKCNDQLKSGLDMVKAHMAFGSIGVPPVIDSTDLVLFCRLDSQHDRCLRDCGFTVQFNMRDYVCKRHYQEMNLLLPCFAHAASMLKRQCGSERCGPYGGAENTILVSTMRRKPYTVMQSE
uniref:Uncharacterized protein n=1 Tax=Ascaris lumbricoides TaxID=6252 RepID=A0A0M3IMF5_ASCLU